MKTQMRRSFAKMIKPARTIKAISTKIWSVSLFFVVLIWRRTSIANEIRSEIKFSVKNQCKSVNMAKLSIDSFLETIHFSTLYSFLLDSGLIHVEAIMKISPEPYSKTKVNTKYCTNLKVRM